MKQALAPGSQDYGGWQQWRPIYAVLGLYFMDGSCKASANVWAMKDTGLGMIRAKRLNPFELFMPHGCKDKKGIQAMLKKDLRI